MSARVGLASGPLDVAWRALRFVRYLPQFARLYWRLFCDRRVSIWPKAVLVLAVVYVVSPIDLLPDFTPLLGEVDDIVLAIAACKLFISMCPRDVVQEHVQRIGEGR
jgi:uncharacterized membrane protein YkvA (DUF1232 family)